MKFTRSTYQGSPCWTITNRWIYADADWNTRWPFGTSLCIYAGPQRPLRRKPGFTLDLNAPLGEPNRLYLWLGRWHVTIGLLTWWTFQAASREGNVIHGEYVRCRPHLAGCSRYRYHRDTGAGEWIRDEKPAPLHWGWLTIEKKHDR